jgi:uncharacterized protein
MDDPDADPDDESLARRMPGATVMVFFELFLAGLALLLGWSFGPDPRALLPSFGDESSIVGPASWAIVRGLALGVVAALPAIPFLWWSERSQWGPMQSLRQSVAEIVVPLVGAMSFAESLAVSVAAGVGEELLFRGWMQLWISGPIGQWTIATVLFAVAVTSLVFGLVHFLNTAYFAFATLLSIYFGLLLIVTGNLLVPIVAHALWDLIAIGYVRKRFGDQSPLSSGSE